MILHFLRLTLRRLRQRLGYTLINLAGLAIGLAVSYQALRTALADPVDSLRYE